MNIQISHDSLNRAYNEADRFIKLESAKRDLNIVNNDGMTINIPEDNFLDKIINKVDHRRLVLEKKAEILNDYYGDRLLTKDLFKDYISQKKFNSHLTFLLSAGLVSANIYTRLIKNSVLLGKVGTIVALGGLYSTGRYLSNNWLENKIERPWKIHNYRMSKGLGKTNTPDNHHNEILTVPLRFHKAQVNTHDLLMGTLRHNVSTQLDAKIPIDKEIFPFEPDRSHHKKLETVTEITPDRWKYQLAKTIDYFEADPNDLFAPNRFAPNASVLRIPRYDPFIYLSREHMFESLNIYRPSREYKLSAFSARKPEDIRDDKLVLKNEYLDDPESADSIVELPEWSHNMYTKVNFTEERLELLSNRL